MARYSLNPSEVSLIKAMLKKGMKNNLIQIYFNRPDRFVNSGRITEIKQGKRWTNIEAASDKDLESFLQQFDQESNRQADDEPVVPDQLPAAAVFYLDDTGRIAVVPDPPGQAPQADPEQEAMYFELRQKTESLLNAGHNLLGAMFEPLRRFRGALPEDMSEASMTILWFRGNTLRSILRAHDEVKDFRDMHPEKLDTAYAEHLRDVVDAFNIFVLGDPKGRELDYQRLGPMGREAADEAIELAAPIVEHSPEVATETTSTLLKEEVDGAKKAPRTIDGDQVVALAQQSSSNFVISVAQNGLNAVKKFLREEFSVFWRNYRTGAYTTLGVITVSNANTIINFIARHAENLISYATSAIKNPAVYHIFDFIAKLFA